MFPVFIEKNPHVCGPAQLDPCCSGVKGTRASVPLPLFCVSLFSCIGWFLTDALLTWFLLYKNTKSHPPLFALLKPRI